MKNLIALLIVCSSAVAQDAFKVRVSEVFYPSGDAYYQFNDAVVGYPDENPSGATYSTGDAWTILKLPFTESGIGQAEFGLGSDGVRRYEEAAWLLNVNQSFQNPYPLEAMHAALDPNLIPFLDDYGVYWLNQAKSQPLSLSMFLNWYIMYPDPVVGNPNYCKMGNPKCYPEMLVPYNPGE